MKIDFSAMKSQLDKLAKEAEMVAEVYRRSEWEDEVQASYKPYISECAELGDQAGRIKSTLDNIERNADRVKESSVVKRELDNIKSQADTIVV